MSTKTPHHRLRKVRQKSPFVHMRQSYTGFTGKVSRTVISNVTESANKLLFNRTGNVELKENRAH